MCGIAGVANHEDATGIVRAMLLRLNHRGTDSAGMTWIPESKMKRIIGKGFVSEVLSGEVIKNLHGFSAIAHNRYTTTGDNSIENIQPLMLADSRFGPLSISHNGDITNTRSLREKLMSEGVAFNSSSDTEVILHLIIKSSKEDFIEALQEVFSLVQGAYSILIQTKDHIYAIRDPNAFRPFYIAQINSSYLFASETVAFDLIDDTSDIVSVSEVGPGEIIKAGKDGLKSFKISEVRSKITKCSFEEVYLSRPDSVGIYNVRSKMGQELAKGENVFADCVISIPDSGNIAALAFSMESNIPFVFGITRDHFTSRTFILPNERIRKIVLGLKHNPVKEIISGKDIMLLDDSLVRGTTIKNLIIKLRKNGAKKIHVRIAAPPVKHPCYYGVAMRDKTELIASKCSVEEIREEIGADTLRYLTLEKFKEITGQDKCIACFDGNHPILPDNLN